MKKHSSKKTFLKILLIFWRVHCQKKNLKKRAKSGIDQECEGSLIAEYVKIWYTCTK